MGSFPKIFSVSLLAEIVMCTAVVAFCLHIAPRVHSQLGLALLFFTGISTLLVTLVANATALIAAISTIRRGAEDRAIAAFAATAIMLQTGLLAFICLTQGKAVNAATAAVALLILVAILILVPGRLLPSDE